MFPIIDDQTKDMLEESGEIQRAYMVTLAFNEAYDAYVEKHKDVPFSDIDGHRLAESFAYTVIDLVFGQKQ